MIEVPALLALITSAVISYNNSVVVAGPLISIGVGRYLARIASGASITLGAIVLGWFMRIPQQCSFDSAIEIYIAILIPMLVSTFFRVPFSASIALIGSKIGSDLSRGMIDVPWISETALLWLLSGVIVTVLTIALHRVLGGAALISKKTFLLLGISRISILIISIASGILLGANTLGFLSSLECHRLLWIVAIGGAAASLPGSAMLEGMFRWFSVKHLSAASIQLSVVTGIAIATRFGLPLSHTYALMLSAAGYSASSGMSIFSRKQFLIAVRSWICSIAIATAISWGLFRTL